MSRGLVPGDLVTIDEGVTDKRLVGWRPEGWMPAIYVGPCTVMGIVLDTHVMRGFERRPNTQLKTCVLLPNGNTCWVDDDSLRLVRGIDD